MPETKPVEPTQDWTQISADILTSKSGATENAKSAASAIGAAAGTAIIPGVGTILGGMIGALLVSYLGIKGKTQHLTWDEVDEIVPNFAAATARQLQSVLTSEQFAQLAIMFPNAYRQFVGNSDWWTQETRKKYYDDYQKNILTQPTDFDRVRQTVWEAAHWILENVDKARAQEAPEKLLFFYAQTLTPSLVSLGITDYKPMTVTTTTPPPTTPPPAQKSGLKFSLAGFSFWELLLLAGAAVGFIGLLVKTKAHHA